VASVSLAVGSTDGTSESFFPDIRFPARKDLGRDAAQGAALRVSLFDRFHDNRVTSS